MAIDCTRKDWRQKVMATTDGKGVNVVQEMVGGQVFKDSLSCLSDFGRLIVYSFITMDPIQINPEPLLPGNKTIRGFYLEPYIERNKPLILLNERNQKLTADEFNIHRNSLAYSIQRIEDVIGEDLNNRDTRLFLIFSFLLRENAKRTHVSGSI